MKVGMLSPVRKKIGLKDNFYYNNAEECSHFKYKWKLREHKAMTSTDYGRDIHVSWVRAITVYKKMVDEVIVRQPNAYFPHKLANASIQRFFAFYCSFGYCLS